MDAQTFLGNFTAITDAPGGVQRLRDLVLDLAVQGVLTQAEAEDAPVDLALTRAGVDAREQSHLYPDRWVAVRLGDIAEVRLGRQRSPARAVGERMRPYLRAANVSWEGLRLDEVKEMAFTEEESARYELRPGDLLLGEASGSPTEVGKPAQYRGEIPGCCFQNTLIRVRFPDGLGLSTDFYEMYFRQQARSGRFASSSRGVGINHLGARTLAAWEVPVPPLAEQERVVAKVDELLVLCDDLATRQEHRHRATARFRSSALHALTEADTPSDLRRAWERISTSWPFLTARSDSVPELRKAIQQLAVSGRLVPQDPREEPAEAAIERAIDSKKIAMDGLRGQPTVHVGGQDAPAPLPTGWQWATVDDLFLVAGGIQKSSKRRPVEHHYPYLRVANVQRGVLDLSEIARFELTAHELERLRLLPGDLLVVEGNGSETEIGRCARWTGEINDCVHQNHLIRCRPMLPRLEEFLLLYLNSPSGTETMKALAVTTSGLYNLSVGKIRSIRFPVPPLAEQHRIVATVETLMRDCDQLEQALTQAQRRASSLSAAMTAVA